MNAYHKDTSQTTRIFTFLSDGSWHSNFTLIKNIYKMNGPASARLAARIHDLKKRGYTIESRRDKVNRKRHWYRMELEPNKLVWKKK